MMKNRTRNGDKMMTRSGLLLMMGCLLGGLASAASADSAVKVPATLAGHAVLPVETRAVMPEDAPEFMKITGKYTRGGLRTEELGTVQGLSGGRPTGLSLPIKGLPQQGHSGIKRMEDGSFWVLADNGYGAKRTSPDTMLFLTQFDIDFKSGKVDPKGHIFLHDPDKKVPFFIVNEDTEKRYLTGSDFDPESFQFAGGFLWVGEEFGPYLIKADMTGKVVEIFETVVDGKVVQSPDNPFLKTSGTPAEKTLFQVKRSKGFEGMASSPDGQTLYPLLEGALWDEEKGAFENVDGKDYLRILEFDVKEGKWTGRSWQYVLEDNSYAIGDFNMIDEKRALVIERDNGEGTADKACKPGAEDTKSCFANIAKFKRVYLIEFADENVNAPVRKVAYIDLMDIQDPNKLARKPLNEGRFTFPFFTIEDVDIVDESHIVVGNDNNYPFSSSREPNQADDNEFILLSVPELLKAR